MSTLLEELNKNKVIEDAVQPNKMSKFAYTEKAYNDNDAAGVDSFNFEAEQNIPSDKISVLQTNETVILKGFRAQASVVPRMLFDHFFGRASYNLNKVHDVVKGVLDAFVKFIGKANGIATLDENGRIPYSQLPESAMEFKGTWDASTNTPTLADGTGDTGDFYVVSVAGTQNLGSGETKFLENDRVIYSEGVWSKLSAGDVRTVNTIQPTDGNITLTGDDINLSGSDTTKVSAKVTSHIEATTGVHGATTENTPNTIVLRNATGKIQADTPSENNDVANKEYVDNKTTGDAGAVQTALDEHIAKTTEVHGATSAPTANKIAIRDGSGRLQVATPSAANDAANKSYVDAKSTGPGKLGAPILHTTTGIKSITPGWYSVEIWGGGGGGGGGCGSGQYGNSHGSGGGGGGGGAYVAIFMYISVSSISVSIGAGGSGGNGSRDKGGDGGEGGTTTVIIGGHLYEAKGGGGGGGGSSQDGGSGGNGGGGKGGEVGRSSTDGKDGNNGNNGNGSIYTSSGSGGSGGIGGKGGTGAYGGGGGGGGGSGYAKGGNGGKGRGEGDEGGNYGNGYRGSNGDRGSGGGGGGGSRGNNGIGGRGGIGGEGVVVLTPFNA